MTDNYIKKFLPNKLHIVGAILVIVGIVLIFSGLYRFLRFSNAKVYKPEMSLNVGDCVILREPEVLCGLKCNDELGISASEPGIIEAGKYNSYELIIAPISGKLRYIAIPEDFFSDSVADFDFSADENGVLRNFEATAVATNEFGGLSDYLSDIDKYYTDFYGNGGLEPTPQNCFETALKIVNEKSEKKNFLRGIPFLLAGGVMLLLAGSPFFMVPENLYYGKDDSDKDDENNI